MSTWPHAPRSSPPPTYGLFVYGTLMTGHFRDSAWPRPASATTPAWVSGALYDLGPYPALGPGSHRVAGELRTFAPANWAITLDTLDRIEGYEQRPDDLYQRVVVTARPIDQATPPVECYAYRFSRSLAGYRLIPPDADGYVRWNKRPDEEG